MVDIVLTLFNKIETLLPIQTFSEVNEQLPSFDEIHSIEIERFNKLHVPKNFGIYLVYEKRTGDVLYIGSSGSYRNDGCPTKQTLQERISNGHSPRRFSEKSGFFGLFPKRNVSGMEQKKLIDCREAYQNAWDLCQISMTIHCWSHEHMVAPGFVERLLLSKHLDTFKCFPVGNKL